MNKLWNYWSTWRNDQKACLKDKSDYTEYWLSSLLELSKLIQFFRVSINRCTYFTFSQQNILKGLAQDLCTVLYILFSTWHCFCLETQQGYNTGTKSCSLCLHEIRNHSFLATVTVGGVGSLGNRRLRGRWNHIIKHHSRITFKWLQLFFEARLACGGVSWEQCGGLNMSAWHWGREDRLQTGGHTNDGTLLLWFILPGLRP